MELIGTNKLTLTTETVMRLLEDAINASRRDWYGRIRITEMQRRYGSFGDFELDITTDPVNPAEPSQEVSNA